MDDTIWRLVQPGKNAETMAKELGIPLAIARVLDNRGIDTPEKAQAFLFPSFEDLPDPLLMRDMDKAVLRIQKALERKERVLVFGDYDADGVLSVIMLLRALGSLGLKADYYIPDRLSEGYGLKEKHIEVALERKASLVISVDCGIKATSFARRARQEGIDVIITDHHQPGDDLPDAVAILNPALTESGYPSKNLAGVGVVFKLLQALLPREGKGALLVHYAKLVAIGTIADVAELRGENRVLVKQGLKALEGVANRGLRSLIESCGLNGKRLRESDVGFRLAPRINAAGRLETADLVVSLFSAQSDEESTALVRRLEELNASRQAEEEKISREATRRVEEGRLTDRYKVLILGDRGWHRGVLGIVASKLKDTFARPVLLFSCDGSRAYGSGRSIKEFSFIDCLDGCQDLFEHYGGHPMAVGCVLPAEKVSPLKKRINAWAESRLTDEDLRRKISVDAVVNFSEITVPFVEHFFRLAPFGVGNPRPLFLAEGVEIIDPPQLFQERHLKLLVRQDGKTLEAVGWDRGAWALRLPSGTRAALVYSLHFSPFRGEERMTLSVEDIRIRHG